MKKIILTVFLLILMSPSGSVLAVGNNSGNPSGDVLTPDGVIRGEDTTSAPTPTPTPPSATPTNNSLDYSGFVKCDGVISKNEPGRQQACNFVALINTAKSIINWAFMIAIPVIIALLAYAGFLYMTGTEGNIKRAKHMMWSAVIGFVIMLSAWFLVTTALKWLLEKDFQDVANTFIQTKK